MAQFTSAVNNWTPTATADGSALTGSGYHALRAAASTDMARILEIFVQALGTSSAMDNLALRRHTTHASTPTNRVPAPVNPWSVASVFQGFITASTNPTNAALATIQHVLEIGLNANGGEYRWVPSPGGEIFILGNTANNDEVSIAGVTGTPGAVSSHYMIEEL